MTEHPWKKHYPAEGRDFTKMEITMPREFHEWIIRTSGQLKMPPWKLWCIALDNEREESDTPFEITIGWPTTTYVEYAYREEAVKLFRFLQKFKFGLDLVTITLFRKQIGIPNKTDLMMALRELHETGMAKETTEFRRKSYLEYPPGYTVWRASRAATAEPRQLESQRAKLKKFEQKIQRERKKLELMEGDFNERPDSKAKGRSTREKPSSSET